VAFYEKRAQRAAPEPSTQCPTWAGNSRENGVEADPMVSAGQTQKEILHALEFDGSVTELANALRYLEERLRWVDASPPARSYRSGTALWFPSSLRGAPDFMAVAQNAFRTSFFSTDSSSNLPKGGRTGFGEWLSDAFGERIAFTQSADADAGIVVGAVAQLDTRWGLAPERTPLGTFPGWNVDATNVPYAEYEGVARYHDTGDQSAELMSGDVLVESFVPAPWRTTGS